MNTLERLDDIEKKVAEMLGKVTLASQLAALHPQLKQEIGSVRAFSEKVFGNQNAIVQQFNEALTKSMNYAQFSTQRSMGVEQSVTSLAKTAHAMVAILSEANLVEDFGKKVMQRIRDNDEKAESDRIESMLTQGTIKSSEVSDASSLVVVSQDFLPKKEDDKDQAPSENIANYRVVELPSEMIPKDVRDKMTGKKVGDQIPLEEEDGVSTMTIKAIYNIVPVQKSGDTPTPPAPAPDNGAVQTTQAQTPPPVPAAEPTAPAVDPTAPDAEQPSNPAPATDGATGPAQA